MSCAGWTSIFHEAAIPSVLRSVEDPRRTILAGVQGTTVVLDVARRAGVRRVVFAASSSAYGDTPTLPKVETMTAQPLSPYAVSKLAGEHMMRVFAQLYGLETVSLRYFNVFGPRQDPKSEYAAVIPRFITAALRKERPIVYGDGEQTRDFCHIDNAVRANLLAASTSRKLARRGGQRRLRRAHLPQPAPPPHRRAGRRHPPGGLPRRRARATCATRWRT